MRNAGKILVLTVSAAVLVACHRQPKPQAENQEMSIESNLADGQLPSNAEIETLPPDESSGTSSGELNAGDDNPDVNDLSNSD
ncbi:MAG TPA: hypothetical protein VF776_08355 [Sphingomicrobium sp.]